ncbi:MAG: helix-turn-helix domain-containing protein [Patescibacteria group bacterium]|nr:helix-turn-helix domain-containing protein [bacterium]MDZ4221860.1 helix-turn-helix domain-containing protein [Patescibacteria group bacterium]
MNSFVSKPIISTQTIGERLRKAREGAGLALEDISRRLRIKCEYLEAIELGSYSELPGEIYGLEFTKRYARALRMDPAKAAELFRAERAAAIPARQAWKTFHLPPLARSKARFALRTLGMAACAGLAVYASLLGKSFLGPPQLAITNPGAYYETRSSRVVIQGQVQRGRAVRLNGELIQVQRDGSFTQALSLPAGSHLLRIAAEGRAGREAVEYRVVRVGASVSDSLVLHNED